MHCLTRLETLVQQNFLLKALRLFVICALTLDANLRIRPARPSDAGYL